MKSTQAAKDREVLNTLTSADASDTGGDEVLRLVQRLFLSTGNGGGPRQVVFSGVGNENGSSSVCASAARALAVHSSRSVCVVYANARSSGLAAGLGKEPYIANRRKPVVVREHCLKITDNFWFAGPELLTDETGSLAPVLTLKEVFAELQRTYDFVLIDSPAADISEDAVILGQVSDGAVLVIDAETTRRITARKAKETLETAHVRLLGAVLNGRVFPIPNWLYDWL